MGIIEHLEREEGFREMKYICPAGKLTIGHGINLETTPMPIEVSRLWTRMIVDGLTQQLRTRLDFFDGLSEARQTALQSMAYQMGVNGVLAFRKMLAAMARGDFEAAEAEALDSAWAEQTEGRAKRVARMIRDG